MRPLYDIIKVQYKGLDSFLEKEEFMPRIPDADIERLKNEVAVERLVESAGIVLKNRARTSSAPAPSMRTASRRWW